MIIHTRALQGKASHMYSPHFWKALLDRPPQHCLWSCTVIEN